MSTSSDVNALCQGVVVADGTAGSIAGAASGSVMPLNFNTQGQLRVTTEAPIESYKTSYPAANTQAIISLLNAAPPGNLCIVITRIIVSVAATSAGGTVSPVTIDLTYVNPAVTVLSVNVAVPASGCYIFDCDKQFVIPSAYTALSLTVSAGGANVTNKATMYYYSMNPFL